MFGSDIYSQTIIKPYYLDSNSFNSLSNELKNALIDEEKIKEVNYQIGFHPRITPGYPQEIRIETIIDVESNIALDKIVLHYIPDNEIIHQASIKDEAVKFKCNYKNIHSSEDFKIIKIKGIGWNKTIPQNCCTELTCVQERPYNNLVEIFVQIKNQDKYKGRAIDVYNRKDIDFIATIKVPEGNQILSFNETLPINFNSKSTPTNAVSTIYKESVNLKKQIIGERVDFEAYLMGGDYYGDNKFLCLFRIPTNSC